MRELRQQLAAHPGRVAEVRNPTDGDEVSRQRRTSAEELSVELTQACGTEDRPGRNASRSRRMPDVAGSVQKLLQRNRRLVSDLIDALDIDGCDCDDLDFDSYACDDCDDSTEFINPGVIEVCNDGQIKSNLIENLPNLPKK